MTRHTNCLIFSQQDRIRKRTALALEVDSSNLSRYSSVLESRVWPRKAHCGHILLAPLAPHPVGGDKVRVKSEQDL